MLKAMISKPGTSWERRVAAWLVLVFALPAAGGAQDIPRARDIGVPFDGAPGPLNAITDVVGLEVGHTTLMSGKGPLVLGQGPVRTGVTAIFPKGKKWEPVFAGTYALNGYGDMTGTHWVNEGGLLGGPVMITNTQSVGIVRDAVNAWFQDVLHQPIPWHQPVVGETSDGFLNDIGGFHVTREHAFEAMNGARTGPVVEGNVGGGTGMTAHGFKGGIGTSSRMLEQSQGGYTVGVLVQANYGGRSTFTVAGVPVGKEITDLQRDRFPRSEGDRDGSIIVVVATDAPLLPHQLERLARRVPLGIAKVGGIGTSRCGN